jgi:Ca-activated chloride channel family protein
MTFTWPLALAALALLPILVAIYIDRDRRRVASQAAFGNPDLLPNVVDREPGRLRYLPPLILLTALVFMIVGVARPHATVSVPREEATIVLAMDVSR